MELAIAIAALGTIALIVNIIITKKAHKTQ